MLKRIYQRITCILTFWIRRKKKDSNYIIHSLVVEIYIIFYIIRPYNLFGFSDIYFLCLNYNFCKNGNFPILIYASINYKLYKWTKQNWLTPLDKGIVHIVDDYTILPAFTSCMEICMFFFYFLVYASAKLIRIFQIHFNLLELN